MDRVPFAFIAILVESTRNGMSSVTISITVWDASRDVELRVVNA